MTPPPEGLPAGFSVVLDRDTRAVQPGTWFGGSPARLLRLTDPGRAAWDELATGPVRSSTAGRLARRLTDAGLAHPRPPGASGGVPAVQDVTVVVPVRDRAGPLRECLRAQGTGSPVLVVDDGSRDPAAVAAVVRSAGAGLLAREVNGGPGAARNSGLARVETGFVAFLDSDCVPPDGWIARLAVHFADPLVAAVAPRIVPVTTSGGSAARYTVAGHGLDLGVRESRVAPGTRVSYVPTAALVVRLSALRGLARPGFDPALRTGEDVDLVWRLHEAGWRVRYDPGVEVAHREPDRWSALLRRRFGYGRSAGPLARRHPGAVPPLVLSPWPAATAGALLAGAPELAATAFAGYLLHTARALRRQQVPATGLAGSCAGAVARTWTGTGRYVTQFGLPAVALALARGRDGRAGWRPWLRRAAWAALVAGPPLLEHRRRRPGLGPARYLLGSLADEMAYGAGVLAGCAAARTVAPVRPVLSRPKTTTTNARRT